jgi:hypothetical protein
MVGASHNGKNASEAFVVNQSSIDRVSERKTEDIMRWDSGRALASERLNEWERMAMEKIEGRMRDFGMWVRDGREVI